ncbi:MAG: thioredoxin [Polyangiaceae bacterium]
MADSNVHTASDLDFDQVVLASKTPVLVDFTATWCGPCKMLNPIVEKLARDRADTLKVVKVDMDDALEISARYGVRAAPTLMVFVGGAKVKTHVGLLNREKIEKLLDA